jgi:hypothetical protein
MHIRLAMENAHGIPDFDHFPGELPKDADPDGAGQMELADIYDVGYAIENNVGSVFDSRNNLASFTGEQ